MYAIGNFIILCLYRKRGLLRDALSVHFPGAISSLRELFLPLSVDFGIEHPPVNAGHTRIDNADGLCGALFLLFW